MPSIGRREHMRRLTFFDTFAQETRGAENSLDLVCAAGCGLERGDDVGQSRFETAGSVKTNGFGMGRHG